MNNINTKSNTAAQTTEKPAAANIGPIFVFLSGVSFSMGGLLMKYVSMHPLAINGVRNAIAAIVVGLFLILTKHRLKFNRHVLIGALAISLTTALYVYANKLTTAGNAIVLQFTAPIWVMVFSTIVLKIKPTKLDLAAGALVIIGVVCFFLDAVTAGNMLGNALALASGITYVGVFMMNSTPDSDSLSATFFGLLINTLVGIPFFLSENIAAVPMQTWAALLILGIVQQGLSYILLNLGLATTGAIAASLISGVEPVLNPILVAIFYGEVLTPLSFVGAAIVLISIVAYNIIKAGKKNTWGRS